MSSGTPAMAAVGAAPHEDGTALARETLRRVSTRLLPFVFVLYVINYIDRTNVALAALGMNRDLGFSASVYSFGAGVFFLGYAPFEAPSNLILVRVGARRWIARIMITWGVIATAMMFVRTPVEFYVLRFLLGVAEAGFFPGIIYYLTEWFPSAQRGRAIAGFMLGLPASGVIGGVLGGWLLGVDGHLGLHGWQWLFLVEGIPAVLLGIAVLFYLNDDVADARWLSDAQRTWLAETLRREKEERGAASSGGDPWWRALTNPVVWLLGFVYLLILTAAYAQIFWTPIVVQDATHASNAVVGWVVGAMAAASGVGMIVAGVSSDRRQERFLHAASGALLTGSGFCAAALFPAPWGPVLGLTMVLIGVRVFHPGFWCIPSLLLSGTAAPLGIGLVTGIGNVGGFIGPYAVGLLKDATGSTRGSFLGMGVLGLCATVLLFLIRRGQALSGPHRPALARTTAAGATIAVGSE